MVPLVGSVMELHLVRDETERILTEVGAERGVTLTVPVGTMIELPRAALTAHRIADAADFFSFGTNDLTQTTWGFSRDDVESTVFAAYLEKGVFTISPFETIDADGIGRLVEIAAEEGRKTAGPQLGVCGEHGGDPGPSTSSTAPGWTTCPAHRSGCRSPASRPAAPPWAELPAAQRGRCGRGQRRQRRQRGGCDGARRVGPRRALRTSDPPGPMPLTIRSAPVVVLLVATGPRPGRKRCERGDLGELGHRGVMFGAVRVHRRAAVQARTGGPHPHLAGAGELSGDHALGTALRAGDPAGRQRHPPV